MSYSKFKNVPTMLDGIRFASRAEANRYAYLKLLEKKGEISHLELQPVYKCVVDGTLVCTYRADFRYFIPRTAEKDGQQVVEDLKGYKTPLYRLKKKLVEAIYRGVVITEVSA